MSQQFQRTIEDFECLKCGAAVVGNGYTNHCPKCLWSRHVDVMPGDRAEGCQGMMEPVELDQKRGVQILTHECVECGFVRRNRIDPADEIDAIIHLAERLASRRSRS